MKADSVLPIVPGAPSLDAIAEPMLVDPEPTLLTAVVEAYRAAAPALVDPALDELRTAAETGGDPLAPLSELPTLTVLANERVVDRFTDRFRSASRLAALIEAGVCRVLTGIATQPNPVLVGEAEGCVLVPIGVDTDGSDPKEAIDVARDVDRWASIGDDPALRELYTSLVDEADGISEYGIRTPSRHRVYGAFRSRCGAELADDVIRSLGVDPEPAGDDQYAESRTRAYAVGVSHGALDGDLRRACEDAGLGSRSTFTRIKRELREAGLLTTESVPQPVGRPRERLVARGALARADGKALDPPTVVEAVRDGLS